MSEEKTHSKTLLASKPVILYWSNLQSQSKHKYKLEREGRLREGRGGGGEMEREGEDGERGRMERGGREM